METPHNPGNTNALPDGNSASKLIDHARSDVHQAIDEATSAARPAVERLASEAHRVVDRLVGAAHRAGDNIEEGSEEVGKLGTRLSDGARDYVGRNPLAAVGIAVAAGFILSRFIMVR